MYTYNISDLPWTLMGNSAISTLASRLKISKSASAHNKFGSSPMAYKHPSSVSSGKIDWILSVTSRILSLADKYVSSNKSLGHSSSIDGTRSRLNPSSYKVIIFCTALATFTEDTIDASFCNNFPTFTSATLSPICPLEPSNRRSIRTPISTALNSSPPARLQSLAF